MRDLTNLEEYTLDAARDRLFGPSTWMQAFTSNVACGAVRARAALLAGGGEEVAGAVLGSNTTHVICNPDTASQWLSMGALTCGLGRCSVRYETRAVLAGRFYALDSLSPAFAMQVTDSKPIRHVSSV